MREPLHVGYITQRAFAHDGWGRYTVGCLNAVQDRGIRPLVISAQAGADAALGDVEQHVLLPPPFGRGLTGYARWPFLVRGMKELLAGCDVVHCLVEPYLPLVAMSMPRRTPLVLTAHGTWAVEPFRSPIKRQLLGIALRRVDRVIFQSAYTRERMSRYVDPRDGIILPGGVDLSMFSNPSLARLPDWASRGPFVLSVGALKARKGHGDALQAVAIARQCFPDLQLVLIGEGEAPRAADEIRRRANELGMANHVHLFSAVPDEELAAWYQQAALFLLLPVNELGSFEGLGLAYLEAAAAGLPSIATRGCGAAEAVVDMETGLLVPQRDPGAASRALVKLLGDAERRARMGQAGRRWAAEFDWSRFSRRLIREYVRLLDDRHHG